METSYKITFKRLLWKFRSIVFSTRGIIYETIIKVNLCLFFFHIQLFA